MQKSSWLISALFSLPLGGRRIVERDYGTADSFVVAQRNRLSDVFTNSAKFNFTLRSNRWTFKPMMKAGAAATNPFLFPAWCTLQTCTLQPTSAFRVSLCRISQYINIWSIHFRLRQRICSTSVESVESVVTAVVRL